MLLTVHRWFANKACPGQWLMDRMSDLAAKVTAELGGLATAPVSAPTVSIEEPAVEKIHVVVKGETLWGISRQYLGTGRRYTEIKSLNGLTSNTIYPDQKLIIPD
ncbi:MAG: LysM peptidoglycan-binding domain-containing protein [Oscillospiraceae bacterium]|nr:LysM peptidoglycan-binding domain-containing protein [Oscillospiraceae bacterium]